MSKAFAIILFLILSVCYAAEFPHDNDSKSFGKDGRITMRLSHLDDLVKGNYIIIEQKRPNDGKGKLIIPAQKVRDIQEALSKCVLFAVDIRSEKKGKWEGSLVDINKSDANHPYSYEFFPRTMFLDDGVIIMIQMFDVEDGKMTSSMPIYCFEFFEILEIIKKLDEYQQAMWEWCGKEAQEEKELLGMIDEINKTKDDPTYYIRKSFEESRKIDEKRRAEEERALRRRQREEENYHRDGLHADRIFNPPTLDQ